MRVLLSFIVLLIGLSVSADKVNYIKGVISRGNRAYDLSQRSRIKECADSALMLISEGGIHENDSVMLLASAYKLYGNYHYENFDFDAAETCYLKIPDLVSKYNTASFRLETELLLCRDLAQLYYRQKDYTSASKYMAKADDIIESDRNPYDPGDDKWLITKLTYAMCLARIKNFDEAISIAETELNNAIDKTSLAYAKAERMYAKILMLADADRTGALKAYKNYFEKQKQDAMTNFGNMDSHQRNEYWQSLRPFIADCYRLEDADPGFLYDVTLFAKGLLLQLDRISGNNAASEQALKTLSYNWEDIQKRLKPQQSAIEFVQYEKDGKSQMAALVLRPKGKPIFVPLTSPDEILSLAGNELQSTDRSNKDKLYQDENLYELVWTDNLLNALDGSQRIYFAPDGYMHRLAIEYMPPVESLELYRLTSTRRLMADPTELSSASPTLFVGGVNYDLDNAPGDATDNDLSAYTNYLGKSFPRLRSSSNEAKSICEARANNADTLIIASTASESTFMELAPNYSSILVSTHGDFCSSNPIPSDIKTSEEDETLSQNIIAFAGVNNYLSDRDFNAENHYDGLLSAKEISKLDLSKCKLFTVSACQSALGHISSDGVFGLQRGLKNAGVDAMLLSLWNVNSDATCQLMQSFYRHLHDGMSIHKAFDLARNDLMENQSDLENEKKVYVFDPAIMASRMKKQTTSKSFDSPQYVNAFIIIDALD